MSQRIPIYEQFQEVCRGKSGALFTTSELISAMAASFGTPSGSVLPADFCYNRRNKGSRPLEMCLFVQFGTGEYKYLGPNAPYSGLAVHSPKGSQIDVVVGEWVNGVFHPQDAPEPANDQTRTENPPVQSNGTEARTAAPSPSLQALSREQIQHLYEEYCQILDRETRMFGVNPAETRHLIGRIGEFKVALELNGTLAHRVNQEGFDVVAEGRAISVKTTTQKSGFVTVNLLLHILWTPCTSSSTTVALS